MKPASTDWDAVVVGAGVAGGCTAALLADRGWRVLLLEKHAWPRVTVCGGCLCASGLDTLREMGMESVAADALPTHSVVWHAGEKTFEHAIPRGAAILRENLDTAIVTEAVHRGVTFKSGCTASLLPASSSEPFRTLKLSTEKQITEIRAGIVIASDGIDGRLLNDEPWAKWTVARNTLIGLAATYRCDSGSSDPGRIHMCIGKRGYVGIVGIDSSTQHLAAALDPAACRAQGGPMMVMREIFDSCHHPIPPELATARLHGTGKLTRHRKQLGGHRVLTVGDACAYVEPVTGEGMAWAALGAAHLNQIMPAMPGEWHSEMPRLWRDRYLQVIGKQQRWCRTLRTTMHNPTMTATGIFLGNTFPGIARWIARTICEPKKRETKNDPFDHLRYARVPQFTGADDIRHRHGKPTGSTAGTVA